MSQGNNILQKMMDRLLAALVNGPGLNCRPYASRQRLDLAQLAKLADATPEDVLRRLLGSDRRATIKAKAPMPKGQGGARRSKRSSSQEAPAERMAGGEASDANGNGDPIAAPEKPLRPADKAWNDQQAVLNKLRTIAEDARTYEQDTGVSVLNLGFPLLSLPPGSFGAGSTRRVLAPIAFIPMSLSLKRGATQTMELSCRGEGVDLVTPNTALLAWIEQQTGKSAEELDGDEEGQNPWREICTIVRFVCDAMGVALPEMFHCAEDSSSGEGPAPSPESKKSPSTITAGSTLANGTPSVGPHPDPLPEDGSIDLAEVREKEPNAQVTGSVDAPAGTPAAQRFEQQVATPAPKPDPLATLQLAPAPKADESPDESTVICSAVLGLFPVANQGLLRDTQAMLGGEGRGGPVESFLQLGLSLEPPQPQEVPQQTPQLKTASKAFAEERLVTVADPCQARAVRLARQCNGLVVHGPPGTGKSQTITNIIGDHLARGQRVLLVCDKRTALDVVANRLEHMGLGRLCAQVYDPRRDQRELYRKIREQLEELPETGTHPRAEARLAKVDVELQQIHEELTQYRTSLHQARGEHGPNFHELVGQWLALTDAEPGTEPPPTDKQPTGAQIDTAAFRNIELHLLDEQSRTLTDLLKRADSVGYGSNPWVQAAGISLADYLALPMDSVRTMIASCAQGAQEADATIDPAIPPFAPDVPLPQQAAARMQLAERLAQVLPSTDPNVLGRWAIATREDVRTAQQEMQSAAAFISTFRSAPLDASLLPARDSDLMEVRRKLLLLDEYLAIASKWYAFLPVAAKSRAAVVLREHALSLNAENARKLQTFFRGVEARLQISALLDRLAGRSTLLERCRGKILSDDQYNRLVSSHAAATDLLADIENDAGVANLIARVSEIMRNPAASQPFIDGLKKSPPRAAALEKLESATSNSKLFDKTWLAKAFSDFRSGQASSPVLGPLDQRIDTLEGVLRVEGGVAAIPSPLREAVDRILASCIPADRAMVLLRRESLAGEITRRLKTDQHLQQIDGQRLSAAFEHYRELAAQKHELVCEVILHQWVSRQKERLLAATGSRMNSLGADLRRRLTIRGERAMRLRQVVAVGAKTEGGDPLFDLCPIWLCSPETVAQVFPRHAMFDAVVFDEASQCRLEEAVPVIVRGKRLVIAGDPMQLPPTRFFESAVAASEDEEPESDQELFEQQQGEVEDLLAASLGLDIQQSYLDVHYRSKNSDLIAFSNEHFYGSRLQPIPGRLAATEPPVRLVRVDGIYEKRRNEAEANRVVQIVKELLAREEPPSIGIACFNLPQRDLIVEKLDELAGEDAKFGKLLEQARARQGAGSFEGLFVKNLENVQGDERDHIIISTTYGPDPKGKFYRRFGPLGMAGGGRRLNVLVTRARQQVHLVTSIPRESYRTLPELLPGQAPGGGWLLLAYLQYAEKLGAEYGDLPEGATQPLAASQHTVENTATPESNPPSAATSQSNFSDPPPKNADTVVVADSPQADSQHTVSENVSLKASAAKPQAAVKVSATRARSSFAESLANHLARHHGLSTQVYWGNEGFCVDLALQNGHEDGDLTHGILCDAARFAPGDDPIEWDIFRTGILESQGWRLHRLWSPHFFRDPRGVTAGLLKEST